MPVLQGAEGAHLFLELLDKPINTNARLALARAVLDLGGDAGLRLQVERHGAVASLAVFRGSKWSYAFLPAQEWILAYVRPPEVQKGMITLDILRTVFPDARSPQPDHLTVRLRNQDEAGDFCRLVRAHA